MKKLKVAVIGVGHLGKEHVRIFSELSNVNLVGVVDTNLDRAGEIARKYDTCAYSRLGDVISLVDAVSIVVPTDNHYKVAKRIIQAGKSVLIEKPITASLREAQKLVDMAKKRKVFLQVGHVERFNPIIQGLVKLVRKPKFIEIHRLSPFTKRGTEVGVVLDLMIHDIDIILAIVKDKAKRVEAVGVNVLTPREDIANARIVFRNGCVANLTASRVSPERMRKIRIFEPSVYSSIDYYRQEGVRYYKKDKEILKKVLTVGKDEPLKLELEDFVHSVIGKKRPRISGSDALLALTVALEVKKKIWGKKR